MCSDSTGCNIESTQIKTVLGVKASGDSTTNGGERFWSGTIVITEMFCNQWFQVP